MFLGLVNYYGKFLFDLVIVFGLLYNLLWKDSYWNWIEFCEELFNKVKDLVVLDLVFIYYSFDLFIFLVCDVLFYGFGVVIFYELFDGIERLIVFVYCILVLVEKNYF